MTLLINVEKDIKKLQEQVDMLTRCVNMLLPRCEACDNVPTIGGLENMRFGKTFCSECETVTQHSIRVNILK